MSPASYPYIHIPFLSHWVIMEVGIRLGYGFIWFLIPSFSECENLLWWLCFCYLKCCIFHTLWPLNASQPLHLVSTKGKLICCSAGGKTDNVGFTYIERWYVVLHLGLSKYNFDSAWFLSYMLIFVSNFWVRFSLYLISVFFFLYRFYIIIHKDIFIFNPLYAMYFHIAP